MRKRFGRRRSTHRKIHAKGKGRRLRGYKPTRGGIRL